MRECVLLLVLGALHCSVWAFSSLPSKHSRRRVSGLSEKAPFFADLPNPFEGFKVPKAPFASDSPEDKFEASSSGLILQAKRVLATDLGLYDPSVLADDGFKWIGPGVDLPLGKTDYVAAGRFFDLRNAFPDLDYRAYDFRIDEDDPATVRFTCRIIGTMRGELRLRSGIAQPTGRDMRCPPEAVSMTFDLQSGKVVALCTGFCLDRQVGNTEGTTGVLAAALTAGQPISDWEIYPPTTVLQRFFGRPLQPLPDVASFLAPFPETVMIQLAKGVLTTNMAYDDPSLLSDDFTFITPTVGPVKKSAFLDKFARLEFDGFDPNFSNFRVDPYEPTRVWVDLRPKAPGYRGAPQAMSFSFDEDGYCTRATSWAVMDPSLGNGGGLGGPEGFKYAAGNASPDFVTRPLPRILGRVRKGALEIFSGVGVDDFNLRNENPLSGSQPVATPPKSPPPTNPVQKLASSFERAAPAAAPEVKDTAVVNPLQSVIRKAGSTAAEKPPAKRSVAPPAAPKAFQDAQKVTAEKKALAEKEAAARKKFAEKAAAEKRAMAEKAAAERKAASLKAAAERKAAAMEAAEKKAAAVEDSRTAANARVATEKAAAERKAAAAAELLVRQKARKAEAERKKQEAEERRAAIEQSIREKQEARRVELERKKVEAEQQKAAKIKAAQEAAAQRQAAEFKAAQAKKAAQPRSPEQKEREQAALNSLARAASRATIALFGFGEKVDDDDSTVPAKKASPPAKKSVPKTPPRGVPTLSRWRRNLDGSVSGRVSGSRTFAEGETVTTSPIAKGKIAVGEVVTTGSGSRYFLS